MPKCGADFAAFWLFYVKYKLRCYATTARVFAAGFG